MRTLLFAVLLACTGSVEAGYVAIDLAGIVNTTWNAFPMLLNGSTFPVGHQQFGPIPFDIPSAGNNVWSADVAAGGGLHAGTVAVTIPIDVYGATTAYTLINNEWGQPGMPAFASLIFSGSAGTTLTVDLLGSYDIRDYNANLWTNETLSPSTQQIWQNNLGQRLDMQTIDLRGLFLNQVLLSMTLTDTGDHVNVQNPFDPETKAQRTFLSAVTVEAQVPEPGTLTFLSLACPALLWLARLRSRDSFRIFFRRGPSSLRC